MIHITPFIGPLTLMDIITSHCLAVVNIGACVGDSWTGWKE